MISTVAADRDVFSDALALPLSERARLAHDLILSLDDGEDGGADEAWVEEIERRAQEVELGTVELEDWSVVRERLRDGWRQF